MKKSEGVNNGRIRQNEIYPFNAEERIRRFKQSVEDFYNSIENEWFSTSMIREHQVVTKDRNCQISENRLGNYEVEVKEVLFDNRHAFIKPVGTMFEGIWGRIDLFCEARSEMFVLIRKDVFSPMQLLDSINMAPRDISPFPLLSELEWKYVSKYPNLKYETIDSHVFLNIMMKVIHG